MKEADLLEAAWGVIANAGGGDWKTQTPAWQEAAKDWRAEFHKWLDRHLAQRRETSKKR